ncbi:extracellular solute-binding protein [Paenibacillus chungangensis]|uniref:Extracellular solute-binding protein n=1 Tax=Paenibacillus chungangensis TaxID=696535 RepID=A0ABW3HRT6_9BACL
MIHATKKVLAVIMAASLMMTVIGCGKAENNGNESGSKQEDTITYQIFRSIGIPEYPEDGGEGKEIILESMRKAGITGVDYKLMMTAGAEYYTKLNLLASSGEMPDYFNIDQPTMMRFADQGLIQPLDDYLKDMPNLMKMIPEERWEAVKYNGKIYAIPNGIRSEAFNTPNVGGIAIRQDWLDELGLERPTTLDELEEVMRAFANNDPDKNGQKDTYGISMSKTGEFEAIFGAFGIAPKYWVEKNGKIVKGFTTPEAKEALALLQKWYKDGLIDPEFPVMETKQLDAKIINSKVGIWQGDAYVVSPSSDKLAQALVETTPTANVALIAPPAGPQGTKGLPENNPYTSGDMRAISAKMKNPEKFFQFLDWSVSDDENGGFNLLTYGVEGVDFTYDKEENAITQLSSYTELYKKGFSNPVRFVTVVDRRWADANVREALGIASQNVIKNALWKTLPVELDYPDLEAKLWPEYFVKIVSGIWSIEKFDEFVQKYYEQGGQKIEEQANEEWKNN